MKISTYMYRTIFGLVFLLSFNSNVFSLEIADVDIKQQVSVAGIEKPLKLNGAGIRYKFFFKIYVGALYLPEKNSSADVILKQVPANRVAMHFIYDEVEKKKLVNAWLEGFEDNVESGVFSALKDRLEKFNQMFETLHKGDVVLLDYIPQKGTRVTIKGKVKGMIEGEDFNRALLSVWLGEEPVTEDLKEAMLGSL